jgi:hypothetical protein
VGGSTWRAPRGGLHVEGSTWGAERGGGCFYGIEFEIQD